MTNFTPLIAIVGPSGTGKSMAFAAMPQDQTIFLDVEQKGLPFAWKNAATFKQPKNWAAFMADLQTALKSPAKYIVIDSITTTLSLLLDNCKVVKAGADGFAVWAMYNEQIGALLRLIKTGGKICVFTSLEEIVQIQGLDGSLTTRRRAYVDGKVWANKGLESECLAVWSTLPRIDTKTQSVVYQLATQTNGVHLAKTPPMWGLAQLIPNDVYGALQTAEKNFNAAMA